MLSTGYCVGAAGADGCPRTCLAEGHLQEQAGHDGRVPQCLTGAPAAVTEAVIGKIWTGKTCCWPE
jgi:hypothetical protein